MGVQGDGDGEYPPPNKFENPHTIDPHQMKRRNSKAPLESQVVQDLDEMEVDDFIEIPDWVVAIMEKNKALLEEFDREGPLVFYEIQSLCTM